MTAPQPTAVVGQIQIIVLADGTTRCNFQGQREPLFVGLGEAVKMLAIKLAEQEAQKIQVPPSFAVPGILKP